jgi:hypothetical protein
MNWRPFLFVIGLFVLFRALGQLFGDSFDTFFVGGIVVLFFGGILYERSWWSNILDRLGRGSDEERRAIMEGWLRRIWQWPGAPVKRRDCLQ